MRGAECLTDHVLLRSIVSFSINKKKNKTAAKPPCKIDLMKLRDKDKQQKLKKEMDKVLAGLQHQQSEVVEENWNSLKASTLDTAFSVLAKSTQDTSRFVRRY